MNKDRPCRLNSRHAEDFSLVMSCQQRLAVVQGSLFCTMKMGRHVVILACFAALASTVAHGLYRSPSYWNDPWPETGEDWAEVVAQVKTTSERLYESVLAFRRLTTSATVRYSAYKKEKQLRPEALQLPHMWHVRNEIWRITDDLRNAKDQLRLLIRKQKALISILEGMRGKGDRKHWNDTTSICRKASGELREAEELVEREEEEYNIEVE
ncbi:putative transmembrane protein [Toxoplasma gondii TgCatPRC2]|uniref:Transmembrane protein n=10 Tax=Toxoplasma gondii TaxID=5811 RepID=B9Q0L6_TOXGV|nr:hypothetical protein TGME49_215980 [Toxoplasma gondii ME49]EPR58624.1 hypothetical protein TGGT1_215980 [Toxoplasma gondii GT1]ESS28663.1 putative transmembrane protein [Toxoplasma gondii VEG]KAF4639888.1 hypothetical protein TGRH88_056600 [Toxoplasma gondii]KFG30231.1 putative transmembrane protein [Toxoplasma gondii GAB2-2007-GAL-DOM2]KFG40784.1 putative transmembrane protein [Toxoplasma gondii FOU]KYK64337.1 putative transmembrane protein [Toxoplasma gondii TgCatPRC2]PUA84412.1 putativ|eukprot:XP_002370908.2 hypothetical protein TGME49_215980 [Toxoplasma gondii ME49]